jgi:hypothetical protein|tara:strand:- start:223 stop:681 length:459 start_codon:yes stop_codon:yes gene_type:complete
MASSLISSSEKTALEAVMDDVHETFAREITVYKDASQVVIITDPNFNPLYDTGGGTTESIINTPISRTFKVRIQYQDDIKKEYWDESNIQAQFKIEEVKGSVRIKFYASDYAWIKDAKRFDVDGKRFVLYSSFKPHGLFNNKFYTIILQPDV